MGILTRAVWSVLTTSSFNANDSGLFSVSDCVVPTYQDRVVEIDAVEEEEEEEEEEDMQNILKEEETNKQKMKLGNQDQDQDNYSDDDNYEDDYDDEEEETYATDFNNTT